MPLIVVSGPTASGKSNLAIELAKELDAEIINIDSVQVYKELQIGAAKLSKTEMRGIPHHLIDVFEPNETCNVARYCELAESVISEIRSRKKRVILAGGTTMYITCLLEGLEDLPDKDPVLRQELEKLSNFDLVEKLKVKDPEVLTRISHNDRIRLVRALESTIISGKPSSAARKKHLESKKARYNALVLVLVRERNELYERINKRTAEMLSSGLVEETKNLIDKYGSDIQCLKSLGYAQVVDYLNGNLPEEKLQEMISMFTRRFAKRQLTYWRNEPAKKNWEVKKDLEFSEIKSLITEINFVINTGLGHTQALFLHPKK